MLVNRRMTTIRSPLNAIPGVPVAPAAGQKARQQAKGEAS